MVKRSLQTEDQACYGKLHVMMEMTAGYALHGTVFGPETTQFHFFDGTIKQNMIDFMEGQNRLIFTYGVTNAGKTFTFQGTKTDAGILPRSMNLLFDAIKGNVYLKMDLKPHRCRDYVRLTKEQVKVETALKNSILRQYKEVYDREGSAYHTQGSASIMHLDLRRLGEIENRISDIEDRQHTQQTLVDTHTKNIDTLQARLDDLEDRSRRNNLKIVGLPETSEFADLMTFMKTTLPELLVISGFEHSSSIISESEERERESEQYKLNVDSSVKFSVWVSFCEIYNECIFDLLDPISGDKFYKRKTLRLAQDVKGFSFVKDIQWIQVSDAKEACKILALGKKFQSIANTKLNSSSSRSHSIFNIRLLRIDDISRVVKVSELALCDLAGSERCTKTQNEGERLKESGNINTSLLILGKCINALKNSQQSKIPRHVPFRESKLTHYLQSFFSGKGKVCMIVNICQSASSCDETLNVLKFSAVAQKVDNCELFHCLKLQHNVKTKEKIIEDMRTALLEQEQTQTEQDQALEAKIEEADKLTEELEEWKNKYRELETNSCKILSVIPECEKNILQTNSAEVSKLQSQLREYEEKHISERKKWLDEKMKLLAQTKESETHRNKEMRKFAEDRERFIKQQTEIEQLNAQLAEKDNTLLKWREERDQLLSELEIQLKSLLSSNMEKEKEIENLKNRRISQTHEENSVVIDLQKQLTSSDETIKELQQKLAQLEQCQNSSSGLIATDEVKEQTVDKPVDKPGETNLLHTQETKHSTSSLSSIDECQDGSQTVLDSSSISTESGKPSRFPKPELEIHFSPVKPNKFAVKHHGDDSPITVKISRPARKRKSHEMEQDIIRTENKKNALAKTFNKTPCSLSSLTLNSSELKKSQRQNLKKQTSSSSTMSGQKKDGTFQKLGDFFQSSPSIFHTKAKKLLQTISSPKPTEVTVCGKENESKPKRNRRRLYTTDISVPLDIPIHPMVLDKNEKESDHLIMKRRLRTRTAK
ncbi:kinesin-like protein KIF20B [Bombina bombina]|uniref:kinesin-like protein KIF20B n=1 Tax=Bombina bombina TaxID=8345 RepID=UPI00235A6430|nr:kinesin-like protein KIF20B [Bombina bombina]